MPVNEEELPGVSNQLPTATKEVLKNKPTLEEVRNRIPPPSDKYQALTYYRTSRVSGHYGYVATPPKRVASINNKLDMTTPQRKAALYKEGRLDLAHQAYLQGKF